MKQVLSLGAGVQSSALAIMAARGDIRVDEVVFADTGAEKPDTYWYLQELLVPMLQSAGIPLTIVETPLGSIEDYCLRKRLMPSMVRRWCTDKWKVRPIHRHIGDDAECLVGFSTDEAQRSKRPQQGPRRRYPLLEMGMSADDCRHVISDYGWPRPAKSACFICPFQRTILWNDLKRRTPDLFERALAVEAGFHERSPDSRQTVGLLQGKPLWKMAAGVQTALDLPEDFSCVSGYCGL